jgi:predicted flap endonuclease-1-like 5' DNA nuclease
MSVKLFARLTPGAPDKRYGGMSLRRKTSVPDEFGIHHTWDSGDPRWTLVSKEYAEILKVHLIQPWRRGQKCPFEVGDEAFVKEQAKIARSKLNASRRIPDLSNVRHLDGMGLDGQQGIPESDVEPVADPRDLKIQELDDKLNKALKTLELLAAHRPYAQPTPKQVAVEEALFGVDAGSDEDDSEEESEGESESEDETEQPKQSETPDVVKVDKAEAIMDLARVRGIGAKSATALVEAGIMGVEDLANSDQDTVEKALIGSAGITKRSSAKWITAAKAMVEKSSGE